MSFGVRRIMTSVARRPVTLVTFDVDGTLVKGTSPGMDATIHSKAFIHAVGKAFTSDSSFSDKYSTPLQLIPEHKYHGCTDGLISLYTAKYAFDMPAEESSPRLPDIFKYMYEYFAEFSDEDILRSIKPLPGVLDTLSKLAAPQYSHNVLCGLVTGNVEGIARKKMRACGIVQTGVLSRKAPEQDWAGENEHSFLGGFGSDYCSCDIDDDSRPTKDRAEQIAIAYRRACTLLSEDQDLVRVVHVGDAPADILAAKYCAEQDKFGPGVTVSCVGVATGSYGAALLTDLAGETLRGKWEPVVLPLGLADPKFIDSCGIVRSN